MAEQQITLNPGESKQVSFEATPTAAKTYQVSVDGLTGSFVAVKAVVEITSMTVSPTSLTDAVHEYTTYLGLGYWGDPFTISITFSNPFDYDVWVRPDFAFGNLTGEPLGYVAGTLKGFVAEELLYFRLLLDTEWAQGDYSYMVDWQQLYHPQNCGSNMPQFVRDPDGIAVLMAGGDCWLKVPAKSEATIVKQAHLWGGTDLGQKSASLFGTRRITQWWWEFYNNCVPGKEYLVRYVKSSDRPFDPTKPSAAFEVYEPIPKVFDLCVVANKAFYLVWDPHYRTVGGVKYLINWSPVALDPCAAAVPDMVNITVFHGDYERDGTIYTHRWQKYIGTTDTTDLKFEDAPKPAWW